MAGVPEAEKTEKITLNLGLVDLGEVDLLVREGLYANRTDFLRTAVRGQLARHRPVVDRSVERRALVLGVEHVSRERLERLRAEGRTLDLRVLGLATVADDVPPELARATITAVEVLGSFRASPAVKAALADRVH